MDALTYRLLGPADLSVLDRVDEGVFDFNPQPEYVREFFANPANLLAVAILDGMVVGMASGILYFHPDKPAQLFINEVGVSDRVRRRGIGRRLCRLLLDEALSRGCRSGWVATEIENDAARALYVSLGAREEFERAVVYEFTLTEPGSQPEASH